MLYFFFVYLILLAPTAIAPLWLIIRTGLRRLTNKKLEDIYFKIITVRTRFKTKYKAGIGRLPCVICPKVWLLVCGSCTNTATDIEING